MDFSRAASLYHAGHCRCTPRSKCKWIEDSVWQILAGNTHTFQTMPVREKAENHIFVGCDTQGIDQGQRRLHLVLEVLVFTDQYLSVYDSLKKSISSWWLLCHGQSLYILSVWKIYHITCELSPKFLNVFSIHYISWKYASVCHDSCLCTCIYN